MVLDGQLDSTFAYSFIVTDIPAEREDAPPRSSTSTASARRSRSASRTPSSAKRCATCPPASLTANRLWLCCSLLALNISRLGVRHQPRRRPPPGNAPDEHTPLRRHAKTLRRILFCVPGRIVRTARQIIVRLPEGFPHFEIFNATYHAALALPGP